MENLDSKSPAVQTYLSIVQAVINRMAGNSASCKGWCIGLVSAILVVVAHETKPQYAFIALIPTLLFYYLDSYYLALERHFIGQYKIFVQKLHEQSATLGDAFAISGNPGFWGTVGATAKALFSPSTLPFYGFICLTLLIVKRWVLS